MYKYKIIDTHAHIYPDKIAEKAALSVGKFYCKGDMENNGTVERLLEIAKPFGVEKIVVHSVATKPEQVKSINDFVCLESVKHKEFIPFATMHPDMTSAEIKAEVCRIQGMSMRGIKLHPDCQHFQIDGKDNRKILDELDGKLPILYHMGDKRFNFSNPKQLIRISKEYPHLTFIAAHFGGYSEWGDCYGYADCPNVYFDTSSTLSFLPREDALKLLEYLGKNRFMFGTDYPMWSYESELKRVESLGLDENTMEDILYNNAKRILKLEI